MCHSRWKVKPHEMSPNRPETDMKKKIQKDKQIDLFTVFSTFDMDKLGRYGYAKSQNFTGVCVVGAQTCTPPYKRLQNLATLRCIFTSFQQITFKFGNFINFKALFSVVSTDFPELVHVKSWKNSWKGLFTAYYIMAYLFSYTRPPYNLHIRYGGMSSPCSGITLQRSIDSMSLAYLRFM